ncbi:MAG: hypothetical protein ABSH16_14790, partial [Sedimentisphaerales bacterium]
MAETRAYAGNFPQVIADDVAGEHTGDYHRDLDPGGNNFPVSGDKTYDAAADEGRPDNVNSEYQQVRGFFLYLVKPVFLRYDGGLL